MGRSAAQLVFRYRPIMFCEVTRKLAATVATSHKVQKSVAGGATAARSGRTPGRNRVAADRCECTCCTQYRSASRPGAITIKFFAQSPDHGRIGLQPHAMRRRLTNTDLTSGRSASTGFFFDD